MPQKFTTIRGLIYNYFNVTKKNFSDNALLTTKTQKLYLKKYSFEIYDNYEKFRIPF